MSLLFNPIVLTAQQFSALHFDNDLLYIPANDDREYTFGLGLVHSWQPKYRIGKKTAKHQRSLRAGIALYTPDNLLFLVAAARRTKI